MQVIYGNYVRKLNRLEGWNGVFMVPCISNKFFSSLIKWIIGVMPNVDIVGVDVHLTKQTVVIGCIAFQQGLGLYTLNRSNGQMWTYKPINTSLKWH